LPNCGDDDERNVDMRKYFALCGILAAFGWTGMAAAAIPQGHLTGSATIVPIFGVSYSFTATNVVDGGTSFVGAGNDLSGNCDGDGGTVVVAGTTYSVICAHFVASSGCCNPGSPKMRLAFQAGSTYIIARVVDNGASGDAFANAGTDTTLANAQAWVNRGRFGSGFGAPPWIPGRVDGDFAVTP